MSQPRHVSEYLAAFVCEVYISGKSPSLQKRIIMNAYHIGFLTSVATEVLISRNNLREA